jgi:lipopolysaccharide/colanic/teichoic acid biosynthesis glycosyltransferase
MSDEMLAPEVDMHLRVRPARRALDVTVALVLLVVTLPVMLVVACLVLLLEGRPVLFTQERVGENAVPFLLYKFRSMRTADGPGVTAEHDVRVTRIGALLRRTSLDELPQLWHVLRGQMTLVGPRPESVGLAQRYPQESRFVLNARPGLTGPAQLAYRERAAVPPPGWTDVEAWYLTVLVPLRAAADLEFLARPTPGRALRYMLLTACFLAGVVDPQRPVSPPRSLG